MTSDDYKAPEVVDSDRKVSFHGQACVALGKNPKTARLSCEVKKCRKLAEFVLQSADGRALACSDCTSLWFNDEPLSLSFTQLC